jgi:hypothetical protein
VSTTTSEEIDMDNVNERIASAPLPTTKTLRRRQSLGFQGWRFAALNLRIVKMVAKGHH